LLVIATIVITGVFVGYNAWQSSLHEEVEKHFESTELEIVQAGKIVQSTFGIQSDQNHLIK
jgi:hypothetical protein